MKASYRLEAILAFFICVVTGCVTDNSIRLRVSGTPGAAFIARYHVRGMQGEVSTVIPSEGAAEILDVSGEDYSCDVRKADRGTDLTVELVSRGKPMFKAEAPTGAQGVWISRNKNGWRQESY